jgi:hypothetical protein
MNIESTRCDRRRTTSLHHLAGLSLAVPLILVDCSHAPEYGIIGSFFPVGIFCSVGGLLRTAGVRALITRTAIAEHLAAPEISANYIEISSLVEGPVLHLKSPTISELNRATYVPEISPISLASVHDGGKVEFGLLCYWSSCSRARNQPAENGNLASEEDGTECHHI